jgi:hypothetical protein
LDVAAAAPASSAGISQSAAPTLASTIPTSTTTIETQDAPASCSPAKDASMSQAKDGEAQQAVEEKSVVPAVTIDGSNIEENKDVVKLDQEEQEQQAQDTTIVNEDKPWLAEFPNSKGWEELTLSEQVSWLFVDLYFSVHGGLCSAFLLLNSGILLHW